MSELDGVRYLTTVWTNQTSQESQFHGQRVDTMDTQLPEPQAAEKEIEELRKRLAENQRAAAARL